MNMNQAPEPPAVKDPDASHPIAGAWRPTLAEVVHCLVRGDYSLEAGVSGVEPIPAKTAQQIRRIYETDTGPRLTVNLVYVP